MKKFRGKDLTGHRFEKLNVLRLYAREVYNDGKSIKYLWECKCDCGNIRIVRVEGLTTGNVKSCGCYRKERKEKIIPNFIDITGKQFNFLTVEKYLGEGSGLWLCKCDCGNYTKARRNSLETGSKKSCGCWKNIQNRLKKKFNFFKEKDDYIIGYDEKGKEFYIDLEDLNKIKDFYWSVSYNGYVNTNRNNTRISLHRFIMNTEENETIDHINHVVYDNRKNNLRICTDHQNVCNKKIAINNKSGKTGVYWDKNRWRSFIFYNGKTINLGSYTNFEDAVNVRKEAEQKYFGEFAYNPNIEKLI